LRAPGVTWCAAEIARSPHVDFLVHSGGLTPKSSVRPGASHALGRQTIHARASLSTNFSTRTAPRRAANLMLTNYRLLGTWRSRLPPTTTARRAWAAQDDWVRATRGHRQALPGCGLRLLASRNFYVAFLAALEGGPPRRQVFGAGGKKDQDQEDKDRERGPQDNSNPIHSPARQPTSMDARGTSGLYPVVCARQGESSRHGPCACSNPALRRRSGIGSRYARLPRGYLSAARHTAASRDRRLVGATAAVGALVAQRMRASHRVRATMTCPVSRRPAAESGRFLRANGWSAVTPSSAARPCASSPAPRGSRAELAAAARPQSRPAARARTAAARLSAWCAALLPHDSSACTCRRYQVMSTPAPSPHRRRHQRQTVRPSSLHRRRTTSARPPAPAPPKLPAPAGRRHPAPQPYRLHVRRRQRP